MTKKHDTRRYTAEELEELRERDESRTDWKRVDGMTEQQLETAIAEDPDEQDIKPDWTQVRPVTPQPKKSVHLRIDRDVLDWLKSQGKGYQTRINAILRQYMDAHR